MFIQVGLSTMFFENLYLIGQPPDKAFSYFNENVSEALCCRDKDD